jgi:hypothetical protein
MSTVHDGEAEARVHAPAIDVHRAGTALTVVASLLGAGQDNAFAQAVQQSGSRVETEAVLVAVDAQRERNGALDVGRRRGSRW